MATKLEIGIFVSIISLIIGGGTTYLLLSSDELPEGYAYYSCNDTGELKIGACYNITDSPTYGEDVNCKWNQSNPRNYKRCVSGWVLYKGENATGIITNLPDYIEVNLNISNKDIYLTETNNKTIFTKCIRTSRELCTFEFINDEYLIIVYRNGTLKPKEVIRQEREIKLRDFINQIISRKQEKLENEQYIGEEVLEAGEVMLS